MTTEREFWEALRKSLLDQVDAIERRLGISPTTAEIRKANKEGRVVQKGGVAKPSQI